MIARVTRAKEGFADYLISGARKDSIYTRDQKDKTITLYGNLQIFKQTEKYLNKYKNYESQDASFREYGFGATMVIIH